MGNNHIDRQESSASDMDAWLPSPHDLATIFNEVHTERLVLRRPTAEDGPAMFAVHGDPATNLYRPAGPDPDPATSLEVLRTWVQRWEEYGFGYWAIMPAQGGNIMGFGGLSYATLYHRNVLNLYYRFTPAAWGHGYATEMARTAITLAQKYLPQWPVVALTRAANTPSIRTAERAGLVRRPDLDTNEHIVFALGWTPIDHTDS